METQLRTAGPTCQLCCIACDAVRNVSAIYMLATHEFDTVICICVSIVTGMVVLTLTVAVLHFPAVASTIRYKLHASASSALYSQSMGQYQILAANTTV